MQPATKQRYTRAVDKFLHFLHDNQLRLPANRDKLDPLLCDYLEHLWASGEGRALASDTVAGLQDYDVRIRGQLTGAWRLLKTWSMNEIPNRAPPLPQHVLHAMVGWAFFHQRFTFGVSLLLGFYGMLRTGEILDLRSSQLFTEFNNPKLIVSLGLTKGGKRQGASESVVIGYDMVVTFVKKWKDLASSHTPLAVSPGNWRALFNEAVTALQLQSFGFRPYSLRRGGATWWFAKHHSLDKILVQGRWQAPKTARIYINEGLSILAEMSLPTTLPSLAPFLLFFSKQRTRLTLSTLEPSVPERTGGLGKSRAKGSKHRSSMKKSKSSKSKIR